MSKENPPGLAALPGNEHAEQQSTARDLSPLTTIAYAAPVIGLYFFYVPMWSVLPGVYSKYFGLPLTTIAGVVVFIRLFDGIIDSTIGYVSDWHRSKGGSREPWAIAGGLGSIAACCFLFAPPANVTTSYLVIWSMVYFLAFTISEIPHVTWGSELATGYAPRARVYAVRNFFQMMGSLAFYALPLLPIYASQEYTPEVLHDAIFVGAALSVSGLVWMVIGAPAGGRVLPVPRDSVDLFLRSILENKPLLLYFAASACVGLGAGMWFGLLYVYLDSYLGMGDKISLMFLSGAVIAALSIPLWLKLIEKTSKVFAWTAGVVLFCAQCLCMLFLRPGDSWWFAFVLVLIVHFFFSGNNVAAQSTLADIVDYGKFKFRRDRGATYFGFNTLLFKLGIGVGGGLSLGVGGLLGFNPAQPINGDQAVLGLKLGFCIFPTIFALLGLVFILRLPIDRRRHGIIERRIRARLIRDHSVSKGE